MECGPDGCPILAFSDLTPAEQRVQRARIAKKMADQGFTLEQIAKQLNVGKSTIARDIEEFSHDGKIKPAKTATNPKGAGRPKGAKKRNAGRKNDLLAADVAAQLVLDKGLTHEAAGKVTGAGSELLVRVAVAREEGRREPNIDRSELSLTAQEKLDVAIRQYQRKLDAQFEQRVLDEVKMRIDEIVLPHWKKQIDEAQQLYKRRRGAMDKATFNKIRRGLHPDSRNSISDKMLGEAFDTFMGLEKFLLDEKDSPTEVGAGLPGSWDEWEKAKQAATAARRAKRYNKQQPVRH